MSQVRHPKGNHKGGQFAAGSPPDDAILTRLTLEESTLGTKALIRVDGRQRTVRKVDGVWGSSGYLNHPIVRLSQTKFAEDSRETLEFGALVAADMLNSQDANPKNEKHMKTIAHAATVAAWAMGCSVKPPVPLPSSSVRPLDELSAVHGMAQIRCLQHMLERAASSNYPSLWNSASRDNGMIKYLAPDNLVGDDPFHPSHYHGEDGRLVERYARLSLSPHGATVLDVEPPKLKEEQWLGGMISRYESMRGRFFIAAYLLSDDECDAALRDKAGAVLDDCMPPLWVGTMLLDKLHDRYLHPPDGEWSPSFRRDKLHDQQLNRSDGQRSSSFRRAKAVFLACGERDIRTSSAALALDGWLTEKTRTESGKAHIRAVLPELA